MTKTGLGQEVKHFSWDNGMNKEKVLTNLTKARTRLLAAANGLAQVEMDTLLISESWTIREILAHICGWAAWDLGAIKTIQDGNSPGFSEIQDVDRFNQRLVAERNGWSLDQILTELEETQAAIQELVSEMPEREILQDRRFRGPYWNSLAEWLQVAWEHEDEHAMQIETWREQQGFH